MIKTILAHLSGTDCDNAVLTASLKLAHIHLGHVSCLRVVPDPAALAMEAASIDMGTAFVLGEALTALEKQSRNDTANARSTFERFCREQSIQISHAPGEQKVITAQWREQIGDAVDRLIEEGRYHDVVVLAGGKQRSGRMVTEDLGKIILGCGRPVLLTPEQPSSRPFKTIAVAWNNSAEAARAMTAAMPLLKQAREVSVLVAAELEGKAKEYMAGADSIVQQLRWHGISAHSQLVATVGTSASNALLDATRDFDADLLVMGAYGHSRLRELVFGGFTRTILGGVALPVLLFH